MSAKPKKPRGKPLTLYPLTPEEAIKRAFQAKPPKKRVMRKPKGGQ